MKGKKDMNMQKDFDNLDVAVEYFFDELDFMAAVQLSTIGTFY